MRSRARTLVVVLLSALAISALAASSASANWFINGTELGTGSKAALTTSWKFHAFARLTIHTFFGPIIIECKASFGKSTSPELIGKTEAAASSITFEGCEVVTPATGCELEPAKQNIATEAVTAVVTKGSGTSDLITFKPKTKTTFAKIQFNETNTCSLNSLEPLTGSVTMNAPTGQTESTLQQIEGLGAINNNSLQMAGGKVLFNAGFLLELSSGSKWSFH